MSEMLKTLSSYKTVYIGTNFITPTFSDLSESYEFESIIMTEQVSLPSFEPSPRARISDNEFRRPKTSYSLPLIQSIRKSSSTSSVNTLPFRPSSYAPTDRSGTSRSSTSESSRHGSYCSSTISMQENADMMREKLTTERLQNMKYDEIIRKSSEKERISRWKNDKKNIHSPYKHDLTTDSAKYTTYRIDRLVNQLGKSISAEELCTPQTARIKPLSSTQNTTSSCHSTSTTLTSPVTVRTLSPSRSRNSSISSNHALPLYNTNSPSFSPQKYCREQKEKVFKF